MNDDNFQARRVSRSASFVVNADVDAVFPLFGAFEERKWAEGWNPIPIYPEKEIIEEGTTFKVKAHGHGHDGEGDMIWFVSKYEPENHVIQYLVNTVNRIWTITVRCERTASESKTKASVTYSFTGLNPEGNELNEKALNHMFQHNLQDWADEMNGYLDSR